jgi:parallel beta-helix repeat protein
VGGVQVSGVSRFTLRNARLISNAGAGLSIHWGSGHRVLDSELGHNGQIGFSIGDVSDTLIARNWIHDNNRSYAFDAGWEAGGGKFGRSSNVVLEGNRVHHNGGPGLWGDISANGSTFRNNRIHHNGDAGIAFEISTGATITGNVIWENGWHQTAWGWGGGIVLSSSGGANVYGNTLAWNGDGISVISQNRPDRAPVTNNEIRDNVIILGPQPGDRSDKILLGWLQDWAGGMYAAASNNRGSGNRYWTSIPEPQWARFVWNGSVDTLEKFNATPGEEGGSYLTTSQMTAHLQGLSVPTSPIAR